MTKASKAAGGLLALGDATAGETTDGTSADTLMGGQGEDTFVGDDTATAGETTDGTSADTLMGGQGEDTLTGDDTAGATVADDSPTAALRRLIEDDEEAEGGDDHDDDAPISNDPGLSADDTYDDALPPRTKDQTGPAGEENEPWSGEAVPTLTNQQAAALQDLRTNRYGLYYDPARKHFTTDPGGGGAVHSDEVVLRLIPLGLAYHEPSGGAHGTVKITKAGQAHPAAKASL